MSIIRSIRAYEILDSRGRPTVEAEVALSSGITARASVPSGASTGRHEAVELRDGDASRFGGRGVLRAVANVDGEIAARLTGLDARKREEIDAVLRQVDGTADCARLGGNALLAASVATARAGALSAGIPLWQHLGGDVDGPLPRPMVNALSGGLHAGRSVDLQDYLVIPIAAETFPEAIEQVARVLAALADEIERRNALRDRRVRVDGRAGTAGAIAPDGRLMIVLDGGDSMLVESGEVELGDGGA